MNLAYVRSATLAMLALGCWLAATAAPAQAKPRAVVAVLPYGTTVEEIAAAGEIAPGVMSAGLGAVPGAQTYLDITQGNRVNEALYGPELPRLVVGERGVPAEAWERVRERAEDAPAEVVPGLLATTLAEAGVRVSVEPDGKQAALIAVDQDGRVTTVPDERCGRAGCGPGLSVLRLQLSELAPVAGALGGDDLLIAMVAAPPPEGLLPIGIAGPGFDGDLTSDSTRTDGVVTSTDLAPTILGHFDVGVPGEVNGSTIRSAGEHDPAAVDDLRDRLGDRPSRDLVALVPLAAWLALTAIAALVLGRRGARVALRLLALACAWAPLTVLAEAALDLGELGGGLVVGFGSVALAAATAAALPGCAGLALACAATVGAHAVDVVAGSPLTALSVLGPNPGGGVRFFGIGNEHEAILTTLTLVGTGAFLSSGAAGRVAAAAAGSDAPSDGRRAAAWFAVVAVVAAAAFAPGRFGADVGAAIVLGVGGGTAVALSLGLSLQRTVALVVAAGVGGVAALVAIDLALGGAHFSRSVLGAGEAGEVADVLDRRLTLMVRTFTDPVYPELLACAAVVLVAGLVRWRRVLGWFGDRRPARDGFIGALVGVLVGTLANDSGSILLVLGTIYLAVSAGFFWATRDDAPRPRRRTGDTRTQAPA
ncbi:MAG: hypothetical protein ACRDK9_10975 [Solirubrobacterales bacterium]